uniref:Uncharacterized protein n=1 Tax=Cacopsylla melanoneura TaxID=428564 RepID=A0A8D9FDB8_9HEMI
MTKFPFSSSSFPQLFLLFLPVISLTFLCTLKLSYLLSYNSISSHCSFFSLSFASLIFFLIIDCILLYSTEFPLFMRLSSIRLNISSVIHVLRFRSSGFRNFCFIY